MSKNQHGVSGLPVRAPLQLRQERYERIRAMRDDEKLTFVQIADLSAARLGTHISKERVQQIYKAGMPSRGPGRPWYTRRRTHDASA